MKPLNSVQHRFEVLDGLRGIAALLVMGLHFTQQYHFAFLNNIYLAVDVFFVLSGFVVSHAYAQKLRSGMSNFEYIVRRVARLFPFLCVGAVLGFLALVFQSATSQSGMSYWQDFSASAMNMAFVPYLNMNFVDQSGQQAVGLIFPGNSPMWSIFFELIASLLFIPLIKLDWKQLWVVQILSLVLLLTLPFAIGSASFAHPVGIDAGWSTSNFLVGFPRVVVGFVSGMLIYRLWCTTLPQRISSLPQFILQPIYPCLFLILILAQPWTLKGVFGLVVVVFAAPLVVAWGAVSKSHDSSFGRLMVFLGWLSFPIYCLHEPILTVTRIAETKFNLRHLFHMPADFLALAVVFIVSIAAATLFDKMLLQKRLVQLFLNPSPRTGEAVTVK